jgi:hypothetical protein
LFDERVVRFLEVRDAPIVQRFAGLRDTTKRAAHDHFRRGASGDLLLATSAVYRPGT